jgi:hypothetical protein
MSKKKKLTPAQGRIVSEVLKQKALCVGHTMAGDEFFLPDGTRVDRRIADSLIAHGILKPNTDGMFGSAQTYSVSTV